MTVQFSDKTQNYECTDCDGFCCRNGNRITVSTKKKEQLLSLEAVRETLQEKNVAFSEYPLQADLWYLPIEELNGKQRCAFLDKEDLCVIHNQHGHEAKPDICKAYPFSYVEGQEEKQLAYTFQCKSIRENYGKPLAEVFINDDQSFKGQLLPGKLPLRQIDEEECSQIDYLAVWEEVRKTFEETGTPEKVIIQHLTQINGNFSQEAFHRSVPVLFSFFWNISIFAEPVTSNFSKEWFQAFETCLKKLDLKDQEMEREALNPAFWKSLQIYHQKVPFLLQDDRAEELLQRYFLHVIDRKIFLMKSPSLFLALTSLLYCWEFIKLHTKILSIIAQEEAGVSKKSLEQAIIDTEGNFAFHKLAGENLYPQNIEKTILPLFIK